jgi:hypothetical protein
MRPDEARLEATFDDPAESHALPRPASGIGSALDGYWTTDDAIKFMKRLRSI